jgi:hypothetical protein
VKKNLPTALTLLCLLSILSMILIFLAFQKGQQRYRFEPTLFPSALPILLDFERYSGTATVEDDHIRADFSPSGGTPKVPGAPWFCHGFFAPEGKTCYLLSANPLREEWRTGTILTLEKAEYVEPFIEACLRSLQFYDTHGQPPSGLSSEMVAAMPWQDQSLRLVLKEWQETTQTVPLSHLQLAP